jgi:hypothetical protein
MANHRLPAAKADVSGAAIKNPQRHKARNVPKGTRSLGQPYARMTPGQAEAWEEFREELPWLNSAHRALLQLACVLRDRLNNDPEMGVNALSAYSSILSKLAATPVDETKVGTPDGEDEDPADQFFRARPH